MPERLYVFFGAALAALGVALGALGAHALKHSLAPEQLETFRTAVHYQMLHALGLILVGLVRRGHANAWIDRAAWTMLAGVLLFSGFLYAWIATGLRWLMYPVPVGGVALVVAWALLAAGALVADETV
jgi:uncharacterized membrane protein YgdD (TMEM256/DUF423 family)